MQKLESQLQSWEKQNLLLLYEVIEQTKKYGSFTVFLVYLILRRAAELFLAVLSFGGIREHRFHISPEVPSLSACEQNWSLHQKVGPRAFIR